MIFDKHFVFVGLDKVFLHQTGIPILIQNQKMFYHWLVVFPTPDLSLHPNWEPQCSDQSLVEPQTPVFIGTGCNLLLRVKSLNPFSFSLLRQQIEVGAVMKVKARFPEVSSGTRSGTFVFYDFLMHSP